MPGTRHRATQNAIDDLRHDGLSLARIAERQKVDPQKLVAALTARRTTRIETRVRTGALTPDQATALNRRPHAGQATALKVQLATGAAGGRAAAGGRSGRGGVRTGWAYPGPVGVDVVVVSAPPLEGGDSWFAGASTAR